ncbi:MAG: hypothetical protein ACTSUJ_05490 [Candidatus Njordarchaeales archaeon]
MKNVLRLILLNKAYYHLILGYRSLAMDVRESISSIVHFDIAVELKLNTILLPDKYKRISDREKLSEVIKELVGLDKSIVSAFLKYIIEFKEIRAKAVHYGYFIPTFLFKTLIRDLTSFVLYEIDKSYFSDDFIKVLELSESFRQDKILYDEDLSEIPREAIKNLLRAGLLIPINERKPAEISDELLDFFCILDNNAQFRKTLNPNKVAFVVLPILCLCSPEIRQRLTFINSYLKASWRRYNRFKIRHIVLSSKKPETVCQYIDNLIEYARKLAEKPVQKPSSFIDFLYSGIAQELHLIFVKCEELKKKQLIDNTTLKDILETFKEELRAKQEETRLLFNFFGIKERNTYVTYASMLSEAALLHLLRVAKKVLLMNIPKEIKRSVLTHINQISRTPALLES